MTNHLWLGSQKENIADAVNKKRMAAQKKTHCTYNHELSGENLIIHKRTSGRISRECRICVNKRQRERLRKNESRTYLSC